MTGVSILSERRCLLGEGPAYDEATDTLFWFDILNRQLLEFGMASGQFTVHDLPVVASALMPVDATRQLLVADDGFYLRERASGQLTLHTPLEAGMPGNRSNDARAHPSGAIWAGTMGRKAQKHAGAIYWFRAGEVRLIFPNISIPNSICFSSDGGTAYFTDTEDGVLWRVACDPSTGLPVGEPSIFVNHRGKQGWLDGSVVDADGILWNACWGAACVNAYDRDGRLVETIALPARQTSCPVFVGRGLTQMAVTSATEGMGEAAMNADPDGGKTFLVDRPMRGVAGPTVLI